MRERNVRIAVMFIDLFAAVSAIVGAIGLVVGFMKIPLSVLVGTPFTDFTIPALLLGVVVGGSALVATGIVLFGPRRFEALAAGLAGCVMVGWMIGEFILIGIGTWVQVAYLVVGILMIGLAGLLAWTEQQVALRARDGGISHHAA